MEMEMARAGRMVLCALAVLVTALMGARAVTCGIAGQPQPHALPGIIANTTNTSSSISSSSISSSSSSSISSSSSSSSSISSSSSSSSSISSSSSSSSSISSSSSSFSSSSSPRLCSAAPARRARSYPHLQGDTRRRKLYSFQSLFLRIDGSGRVSGTRSRHDVHTVLEITSVDVGVVAIRSLTTGYYLTMNRRGEVFGKREYSVNCQLKERIEENGYNTYASAQWRKRHRAMFISLNAHGKPLRGTKTHRRNTNTHFLPISV